jgi:hypothetical protein
VRRHLAGVLLDRTEAQALRPRHRQHIASPRSCSQRRKAWSAP